MMKRYEIGDYTILNGYPYSFQLSTKEASYKIREPNPDPEANYPVRIDIDLDSLNDSHIVLYTPKVFMRFVWMEAGMGMEATGQLEMGVPELNKEAERFISWTVLRGGIPKEVIDLIIQTLRNPENVKHLEKPLFPKSNENNENKNNFENLPTLNNVPPPPPSPPKSKKRVFKIAKKPNKTQRRRRNV